MMADIVDKEHIDEIQDQLNELIMSHTEDAKTLLSVASVLFSSSLKCYGTVLGDAGVVKFLKMTLENLEGKSNLH